MFFSQSPKFMNLASFLSIPISSGPFLFLKLIDFVCVWQKT